MQIMVSYALKQSKKENMISTPVSDIGQLLIAA